MKNTVYQNKIFYDKKWREDTKRFDSESERTIKCSCGHSIVISKSKKLCSWCGNYVYKDKKIEFEEKLKNRLKRVNNEIF